MKLIFNILYLTMLSIAFVFLLNSCNKDKEQEPIPPADPLPAWKNITAIDTSVSINALQFTGSSTVWMTGDSGRIFNSNDGGTNWTSMIRPGNDLKNIFFLNAAAGWICGSKGLILHTQNGSSWDSISTGIAADLYDIQFITNEEGWAVGAPGQSSETVILHTINGGISWNQQLSSTTNLLSDFI